MIKVKEANKMTYDIYVNGEHETSLYFIDDVVDYVNRMGLTIVNESEYYEFHYINIYCERDED